jgi:sulfur carrier protein
MNVVVTANGQPVELEDGAGLLDLLELLGLGQRWVVVERNGEAVDRPTMPSVRLTDGDRLEIVRAVAGG